MTPSPQHRNALLRDDRPKAVLACIALLLLGGGGIAWAVIAMASGQRGASGLLVPAIALVLMGIVLVVTVTRDPYPTRAVGAGRPPLAEKAHLLEITVGEREQHTVSFRWDQVWGWLTITVDGALIAKQLVTLSVRLLRVIEFTVGEEEQHLVRCEKRRTLIASFARPQPLSIFVDGTLVATDDRS